MKELYPTSYKEISICFDKPIYHQKTHDELLKVCEGFLKVK